MACELHVPPQNHYEDRCRVLPPETSENFVSDVPKQYKDWIKENEDKMQNWKRKPEFMERNEKYWKGDTKK